jgi:hypothetical protein
MAAGLKDLPKLAIANEADSIKVLQRKLGELISRGPTIWL